MRIIIPDFDKIPEEQRAKELERFLKELVSRINNEIYKLEVKVNGTLGQR